MNEHQRGILEAAGAYLIWGLLPIYWKWLDRADSIEILAHRVFWSMLFLGIVVLVRRDAKWVVAFREPRLVLTFLTSATLLAANWGIYIWAVVSGRIVETSLGYFIAPLVLSGIGVLVLGERLHRRRAIAIGIAAAGVLWLTFGYGSFPWVAVSLAGTWSVYGLIRKVAKLGSLHGLLLETIFLAPVAAWWILRLERQGSGTFLSEDAGFSILLVGAGVVTSIPLLLFASAARRVSLVDIGLMQFVAPTIQFLIGVLLYGEDASGTRMIGFAFIWFALLVYAWDLLRRRPGAAVSRSSPSTPRSDGAS